MIPIVHPDIEAYAEDHTTREPLHLITLADDTRASTDAPQMMVGRIEGRLLKMLVQLSAPRLVLEIGTFTGYSALSMAEALPPGGKIVTCEINQRHLAIARKQIGASPYADRIEIRPGPALETIDTLSEPFDFVFIDADKTNYINYLDAVLPRLTPNGVVAVDNVLWSGKVLDTEDLSADTIAIRAFNTRVANDSSLESVMIPVRDGLTLIRPLRGM